MELRFEDLSYAYPLQGGPSAAVRALTGATGSLGAGELLAVIGPNGAGKSTLVRLLAGLATPGQGRVLVDGAPLGDLTSRERARRVAVVPQYLAAFPEVHVEDFVLGGRYAHLGRWRRHTANDQRVVREALAACDVGELGGRLLTALSGGQRQRVLVARALAQEAPFLLVDEPTNNLDPGHQLAVMELLARLTCEGRAVLVVTHDLNLASQFATSLLLLDEGRVVTRGTPREVLTPAVLEPVYGPGLVFGELPTDDGTTRPFALPWR